MSWRLLRAFAWLQWRLLVNGLRGGRRRDAVERFSRIGEVALPAAMILLMIPVLGGMAGAGAVAGWHIATNADHARLATAIASLLLLTPMAWLLMRPLLLAGQGGVERGELLRLLPVPTSFLRHLEVLKVATDPILLIFAPALLCIPIGAFAAGRPLLGLAALGAAMSFVAVLLGLGALVALATQLLLRNRQRGELAMLLFFLLLSVVGILPQLVDDRIAGRRRERPTPERSAPAHERHAIPGPVRVLPSGLYAATLRDAAASDGAGALVNLAALAGLAALVHAGAAPLHRRLLETPETGSAGRGAAAARVRTARLPLVAPATAAVAMVHVRTATRTVRGKMILLSPLVTSVLFAFVFSRRFADGTGAALQPFAIAGLAALIALANLSALTANQFAVDGGGLVVQLLQPLGDRQIVDGKAIGSALLLLAPLAPTMLGLALIFPSTHPALWPTALLAGLAALVVLAPLMAGVSAVFPKSADLGKLGKAGQPHSAAGLIAFFGQVLALAPGAAIVAVAWLALEKPWLAPVLAAAWVALAFGVNRLLTPLAARTLAARRENLALVATGR